MISSMSLGKTLVPLLDPGREMGRDPFAALILRANRGWSLPTICASWINERVDAKNQRVPAVTFLEGFPPSTAGKTRKRILRKPLADRAR
jgi:hypothetical protein